jgi:hypothetical protein
MREIRQFRPEAAVTYLPISFGCREIGPGRPGNASCTFLVPESTVIKMADRRTAERLIVPGESLERISMHEVPPLDAEPEEQTQPLRLSFLALLAERDPHVQARLNQRRKLALAGEEPVEDDRPTDPMLELDEPA